MRYTICVLSVLYFTSQYSGCNNSTVTYQKNDNVISERKCDSCNIEKVRVIRTNIEKLDEVQLIDFIGCYNQECFTDVEFAESANSILFILFQKKPELLLKVLSERKMNIEFLKKVLENPVNESIDIQGTYKSVSKVSNYKIIREQVLNSLKNAIDKNKH